MQATISSWQMEFDFQKKDPSMMLVTSSTDGPKLNIVNVETDKSESVVLSESPTLKLHA